MMTMMIRCGLLSLMLDTQVNPSKNGKVSDYRVSSTHARQGVEV